MTFSDKLVVIFLIVSAVASMIVSGIFMPNQRGERVVITVDGEEYASYNFSEIDETKTIEINTDYGMNTVEITKDSVRVTEADCPDKLDVKEGAISKANEMIICLPNRLMIEIEGGERKVDKVTF